MADPTDPTAGADPSSMGAPTDPSTDDSGDTDQGTVLCTIMALPDGTYSLIKGDEDEGGDTGDDTGGAGSVPAAGGMDAGSAGSAAPSGMGSDDGSAAGAGSSGTTYDSVGSLLKAVLDVLKDHEAGSDGSEDDNFDAGFTGSDAPTMKQPPASMRS